MSKETWPEKWGCEPDLRKCVGKTIERVEFVRLPGYCTWSNAAVIRFTDGSRAYFAAGVGTGVVSPTVAEAVKCGIFTKEEINQQHFAELAEEAYRAKCQKERKLVELQRIHKELGIPTHAPQDPPVKVAKWRPETDDPWDAFDPPPAKPKTLMEVFADDPAPTPNLIDFD